MLPVVSVCCITYNHESYIRKSIEGFLMQKTTFPIEIIIGGAENPGTGFCHGQRLARETSLVSLGKILCRLTHR